MRSSGNRCMGSNPILSAIKNLFCRVKAEEVFLFTEPRKESRCLARLRGILRKKTLAVKGCPLTAKYPRALLRIAPNRRYLSS